MKNDIYAKRYRMIAKVNELDRNMLFVNCKHCNKEKEILVKKRDKIEEKINKINKKIDRIKKDV